MLVTIAGLTLPELSAFDPPVSGEGSLDPMGLAVPADRLAELLAPGIRARMSRIRFVTAMAVSSIVCETLLDELPGDDVSTPSVCFEWVVLEAFIRRLRPADLPQGLPGVQKARTVIARKERLSAATYLKGPRVFGFHGVYKPFAMDAGVVGSELEPGQRSTELVRIWEQEAGFEGFADDVRDSDGARFRRTLLDATRNALREGRCVAPVRGHVFGAVAESLHPDNAEPNERRLLRRLAVTSGHDRRDELARLLPAAPSDHLDHELLLAARPRATKDLRAVIDAIVAYEALACLLDACFAELCRASHAMGAQPLTPDRATSNSVLVQAAASLPDLYITAVERMAAVDAEGDMEVRLGEFAIGRPVGELVEVILGHHERIQAQKPPTGKRSWFEPLRNGWVVRPPYGTTPGAPLDGTFLHPMRVVALNRFLMETAP